MGKETREILKKILAAQEQILAHLNLSPKSAVASAPAKSTKKVAVKRPSKKH